MRFKKNIALLLLVVLVAQSAFMIYTNTRIEVFLDGVRLQFDVPPQIVDDRTMVPFRAIFEALGMEVSWYPNFNYNQQMIWAKKGNFAISMIIGENIMQVGSFEWTAAPRGQTVRLHYSEPIELDVPPMIVNDRTLVPLRAVSESIGATVVWDGNSRTVTIETFEYRDEDLDVANNAKVVPSTADIDRGFRIIDGNIYDKYGRLLIEVDDYGFTSNGAQISPYFSVIYGGTPAPIRIDEYYPHIDRANGTWDLPKDGIMMEQAGSHTFREFTSVPIGTRPFTMTSEHPRLRFGFLDGDMPYVDFVIINSTRNREEARIVGLPVGHVQYFDFSFESSLTDSFYVRVVPQGGYGEARLLVQQIRY